MNLRCILTSVLLFWKLSASFMSKGVSGPARNHYCNLIQSTCVSCSSALEQGGNPRTLFSVNSPWKSKCSLVFIQSILKSWSLWRVKIHNTTCTIALTNDWITVLLNWCLQMQEATLVIYKSHWEREILCKEILLCNTVQYGFMRHVRYSTHHCDM